LPLRVPEMQSAFHPREQRSAFRRRDVHPPFEINAASTFIATKSCS
jgi:hypothetical protein